MTKAIQIKKLQITEVPKEYQKEEGCIAFQIVEITYSFFGKVMSDIFDTKIMKDGRQIVKDGNGFIAAGYELQ